MRFGMMIACGLLYATSGDASVQTISDGEIVARSEAQEEALETLAGTAERLGELTGCVMTLYIAGADREDAPRFKQFGEAVTILSEDLSKRVDAHITRFATPKMWNMRKGVLQLKVWRYVSRRMDKAEDARSGRKPTLSDVTTCWRMGDKAVAMVAVLGLDKTPAPASRKK